jgi:hypothetical protein
MKIVRVVMYNQGRSDVKAFNNFLDRLGNKYAINRRPLSAMLLVMRCLVEVFSWRCRFSFLCHLI